MPGTVAKIIPSSLLSQPEKAQIAVDGADHEYQILHIENTLTDEHGNDVRLEKGASVEVTCHSRTGEVTATIAACSALNLYFARSQRS
jgi:hypothetical protein